MNQMSIYLMKWLTTILISLLLSNYVFCQRVNPIRKDNLMVITTDSSENYNFKHFGNYLLQNGYNIKSSNSDFLIIVTDFKGSRWGTYFKMKIHCINNQIKIKVFWVKYKSGYEDEDGWEWEYLTGKNTRPYCAWEVFHPLLKDYDHSLLYFNSK